MLVGPERVAITGPNGSGKTTLLSLVSGALHRAERTREQWGRTTEVWVAERSLRAGEQLVGTEAEGGGEAEERGAVERHDVVADTHLAVEGDERAGLGAAGDEPSCLGARFDDGAGDGAGDAPGHLGLGPRAAGVEQRTDELVDRGDAGEVGEDRGEVVGDVHELGRGAPVVAGLLQRPVDPGRREADRGHHRRQC